MQTIQKINQFYSFIKRKNKSLLIIFFIVIFIIYFIVGKTAPTSSSETLPTDKKDDDVNTSTTYNYFIHPVKPLRDPFSAAHPQEYNNKVSPPENHTVINNTVQSVEPARPANEMPNPVVKSKSAEPPPKLVGIFLNDTASAIIIHNNEYYTVTTGSHFADYEVISIDTASIYLKNSYGQLLMCRLKGF
ncbi:hypothetical protein [Pectinatus cerevisiiphilus]|uniref:Uncharacterized protein n=1 Tax=Pectinatus cerevisiiphilus TaxID=86956 RepID=A0A4R3K531_9FIRM|nr:hypothetical protein [Pectinatus cerevisiiphilus]TCS77810.1 hypothetical protein EDC37_11347 [Pectinatus cerevisiiphilus]